MKQFTLKEEFESVEGKEFLYAETETLVLKIPPGGFDSGKGLRIKGFGIITKNESTLSDKLEMIASVLIIQGETAVAADIPIMTVLDRQMQQAENFEFEVLASHFPGEQIKSYQKRTFSKQDVVTEVSTSSGGGIVGSSYEANIRFKHSEKSKPDSTIKLQGLTIEFLG